MCIPSDQILLLGSSHLEHAVTRSHLRLPFPQHLSDCQQWVLSVCLSSSYLFSFADPIKPVIFLKLLLTLGLCISWGQHFYDSQRLGRLIGGSNNRSLGKASAAFCPFCRGRTLTSEGRGPVVSPAFPHLVRLPPTPATPWQSRPPSPRHGAEAAGFPQPIILVPTPCVLHMAFGKIIKQKWNRLRNEHKRINSLELWLHNGNRLPWMNPCTEVMNSRVNALPWVHLYYYITPESIDKVAFFCKRGMALNWIKVNVIILTEANSTADSGKGTLWSGEPELVSTFLHIVWLTAIEGWYII